MPKPDTTSSRSPGAMRVERRADLAVDVRVVAVDHLRERAGAPPPARAERRAAACSAGCSGRRCRAPGSAAPRTRGLSLPRQVAHRAAVETIAQQRRRFRRRRLARRPAIARRQRLRPGGSSANAVRAPAGSRGGDAARSNSAIDPTSWWKRSLTMKPAPAAPDRSAASATTPTRSPASARDAQSGRARQRRRRVRLVADEAEMHERVGEAVVGQQIDRARSSPRA